MRFSQERWYHARNQRQENPWRQEQNAAREADRRYDLLYQQARRLDHYDAVRALNSRALHFVVEEWILVRGQVQPRGVLHDLRADMAGVLVRQNDLAEIDQSSKNSSKSREHKFQNDQPPEVSRQLDSVTRQVNNVVDDYSRHCQHCH